MYTLVGSKSGLGFYGFYMMVVDVFNKYELFRKSLGMNNF